MEYRITLVYYRRIVDIDNVPIVRRFYFLFKFTKRIGNAGNELAFGYILACCGPALEKP